MNEPNKSPNINLQLIKGIEDHNHLASICQFPQTQQINETNYLTYTSSIRNKGFF